MGIADVASGMIIVFPRTGRTMRCDTREYDGVATRREFDLCGIGGDDVMLIFDTAFMRKRTARVGQAWWAHCHLSLIILSRFTL